MIITVTKNLKQNNIFIQEKNKQIKSYLSIGSTE